MNNTSVKKREKLNYMNVLRAIAIIIIVLGHSISKSCAESQTYKILYELFENGTILFVFISGFLFQYLSDKFEYKTYLKKKFINVIMPYIVTSMFGIGILFLFPQLNPLKDINIFLQIPMLLTTGYLQNTYTWYIPMIVVVFLLAKILLKLEKIKIKNIPLLYLFLPFLLLITISAPRYPFPLATNFPPVTLYFLSLKTILIRAIQFLPVYILGMYISYNREIIKVLFEKKYILVFLMITSSIISISTGFHNGNISKIFFTLFLVGFFQHYDYLIISKPKLNSFLDLIANYSFSIFFVHYYVLYLIHDIYKYIFHINDIVEITNSKSLCLFLSIGIIKFLFGLFGTLLICIGIKKFLEKIGIKNTRLFIGV